MVPAVGEWATFHLFGGALNPPLSSPRIQHKQVDAFRHSA